MVQLRGNCKLRGEMCFIAPILQSVYLIAITYSESTGFHTQRCPCCCSEIDGIILPYQALKGELPGWEQSFQHVSNVVWSKKAEGKELILQWFGVLKENHQVIWACLLACVGLYEWKRLALPEGNATCKCLGQMQIALRKQVCIQAPVPPLPWGVNLKKII